MKQDQKSQSHKLNRYTNGKVFFKNVSCRLSYFEHMRLVRHCKLNNVSLSYFLSSAAMYCIDNKIDPLEEHIYGP